MNNYIKFEALYCTLRQLLPVELAFQQVKPPHKGALAQKNNAL